jgi:calcineurin-like phosphoesterase family protein
MALDRLPTFVTSDSHFFHEKITDYSRRPYDHKVMMVKRWQKAVPEKDTILHIGDLFFGGLDGYDRFLHEITPKLPGNKFLILGNHDKRKFDYEALGFEVIRPFDARYRGYTVSFSHYPKLIEGKAFHIHGHIHDHGYGPDGEPTREGNLNVSDPPATGRAAAAAATPHGLRRIYISIAARGESPNQVSPRASWLRRVSEKTSLGRLP